MAWGCGQGWDNLTERCECVPKHVLTDMAGAATPSWLLLMQGRLRSAQHRIQVTTVRTISMPRPHVPLTLPNVQPFSAPALLSRWCQHLAGLDFAPPLPLATQLAATPPPAAAADGAAPAPMAATAAGVLEGLEGYRRQQRALHVIERLRAVKTGDESLK